MYAEFTESEVHTRVAEFAPLVRRIAAQVAAGLPACVELSDLVQTGMMGLLDAARRYQSTQGAQFETYAVQRIRGAILDGLRQCDWVPRAVRASKRRVAAMISRLEQKNGRRPGESELAEALGLDLIEYQRVADDSHARQIVSYDDFGDDEDSFLARHCTGLDGDPLDILESRKLREAIVQAIEELPEREKLAMSLYYEQELGLQEIGKVLGVSESRVCQIHRQSIASLRARLRH
jgi:RNA polymerase sigma factor FliA